MAFLSPRALKNRFQKRKQRRNKNGSDSKPPVETSHRTCATSASPISSKKLLRSSLDTVESKPEAVEPSAYGYEDAAPDTALKNSSSRNLTLDPYGYEIHDPEPRARPRRSSLKGSNPESRQPRRRHSISFDKEVKITPVIPISTMLEDKGDVWLQGKDYYKIINKVNTIVDRTASGKGEKYCVRGLEHMTKKEEDPSQRRTKAWDTVLHEQQIQHAAGEYNDEALSRKYRSCSNRSRMKAKLRAMQDEEDVSVYLEDTRRFCRRMSM